MTYSDSVRFLLSLGHELKVVKWDLERMRVLLAALGDPHREGRFVHVAGTNGKGSTCAMIEASLRANGLRTGLYTSPHLISPRERIVIEGQQISEEAWATAFDEVHGASERLLAAEAIDAHPSFFEAVSAMAFLAFAKANVEVVVLETGLGGRLDATNVVDRPCPTLTITVSGPRPLDNRYTLAIDAFCLSRVPFHPDGTNLPAIDFQPPADDKKKKK